MASPSKPYCVVGYYFNPHSILEAARRTRQRGFKNFDTFTPFAVHGMDDAMGITRTPLPYLSFIFGIAGCVTAFKLLTWTHLFSWPINIGGKPLFALPAYIPIMFELTVLFCGVGTTIAMFTLFLRLPNYKKPIFHPDITNDRFALAIEVDGEEQVQSVKKFLSEIQAQEIHAVECSL